MSERGWRRTREIFERTFSHLLVLGYSTIIDSYQSDAASDVKYTNTFAACRNIQIVKYWDIDQVFI